MAKGSGRTKNLRYGADDIEDLFDSTAADLTGDEELEPVFEIDTDLIDQEANTIASSIINNVAAVYASETFLKDHPDFKKRLDSELQSLKMHYKMRTVDEKIQDELVKAIGRKADNASLYLALPKLQAAMTSTQNKIDATMDRIQTLLKSYQTTLLDELDEEVEEDEEGEEQSTCDVIDIKSMSSTRGSKSFIEQFKNVNYNEAMQK